MDTLDNQAWIDFGERLGKTLRRMREDEFLVIQLKDSRWFVQFAHQGRFGIRAEAVSNAFLQRKEKLNRAAMARLKELGWAAPTGTPSQSTPKNDPQGSPNWFIEVKPRAQLDDLLQMTVRTLH